MVCPHGLLWQASRQAGWGPFLQAAGEVEAVQMTSPTCCTSWLLLLILLILIFLLLRVSHSLYDFHLHWIKTHKEVQAIS